MSVLISNVDSESSTLQFTLSGVDLSYANAIRRTIISDIPTLIFRTTPYEKNKCAILSNTSRMNNELLKQRLSCIPICVNVQSQFKKFVDDYVLEVKVENDTDEVMVVTTRDFKIRSLSTKEYLSDEIVKRIFPPYIDPVRQAEYYMQFVRLRPRISDEISGEKLHLMCQFDVGTGREDGSFNVSGTCAYKRTPNPNGQQAELAKKEHIWRDNNLSDQEIEFEKANWMLLEGMRITTDNSFDFVLEGIGIYDNEELLIVACDVIEHGLKRLMEDLQNGKVEIQESNNTKPNCFIIQFENKDEPDFVDNDNDGEERKGEPEQTSVRYDYTLKTKQGYIVDYTLGNIINNEMYENYFKTDRIHSVAVKKLHPHDEYITMEVSLVNGEHARESLISMLVNSCEKGISTIKAIESAIENQFFKT